MSSKRLRTSVYMTDRVGGCICKEKENTLFGNKNRKVNEIAVDLLAFYSLERENKRSGVIWN